ncbi:MAG: hypothetical protein NFCOHLIN_03037 [Gammaproteobacteria bacterium]|nr:hypothetical protein [Gammaproteobacteria bacterium]
MTILSFWEAGGKARAAPFLFDPSAGIWLAILLVTASPVAADACHAARYDRSGIIATVIDGDTVRLRDGSAVRLVGINAPELAHEDRRPEAFAVLSRGHLRRYLPAGSGVGLVFDEQRRDRHHRLLAHLFRISDDENIQALMLSSGMAARFTVPPNERFIECYGLREEDARQTGAGIWKEFRAQPARRLPYRRGTFVQLVDDIRLVRESRRGIWLEMASGLTVFIDRRDLRYFRGLEPGSWQGRRAHVRGYLGKRERRPGMRLRHPSNIRFIERL